MKVWIGFLLRGLSAVIIKMPLWVRYGMGDVLGYLWFDVFRIRRQLVLDNISRVFPQMSEPDKVRLGRMSLCHMGRNLVDYCYLPFFTPELKNQLFEFHGQEHVEKALQKKRGVCFLTLHMGSGDLASAALSAEGYKIHLVSKEFKLQWLNDLWFGMRRRAGTQFIAPRNSSYQVLKALKRNEIVIFVMDQFTGPPIGVKTRFFGVETGTGFGLALMAQRAESPVVPVYTVRDTRGHHKIVFLPEIPFVEQASRDESLVFMTQKYNECLEEIILNCPEQWMWVHKRWKIFRET